MTDRDQGWCLRIIYLAVVLLVLFVASTPRRAHAEMPHLVGPPPYPYAGSADAPELLFQYCDALELWFPEESAEDRKLRVAACAQNYWHSHRR